MIEVGKTYKDQRGRDVRIIATDKVSPAGWNVVGLRNEGVVEAIYSYTLTGKCSGESASLIIPEAYVKLSDVLAALEYPNANVIRERIETLPTKKIST